MGTDRMGSDPVVEAIEDAEDIDAATAAIEEPGDNIPWEQVKADLGL